MARPAGLSQEVHRLPHRVGSATDAHSDDRPERDLLKAAAFWAACHVRSSAC